MSEPSRAEDLLPEQTGDDTDTGWGERPGPRESDDDGIERYLRERPPHHGD